MTTSHHVWDHSGLEEGTAKVAKLYARRVAVYEAMIRVIGHERSLGRFFASSHLLKDGMRVLDAGCGSGALLAALHRLADKRKLAAEFFGFDLSPEMLKRAFGRFRSRSCHRFHLVPADVTDPKALPDDWQRMDLVVSAGMLEYLPQEKLPVALGALRGRMAPDGAVVAFISRASRFNRFFLGRVWKARVYERDELHRAFEAAGFAIESLTPFRTWGFAVVARPKP